MAIMARSRTADSASTGRISREPGRASIVSASTANSETPSVVVVILFLPFEPSERVPRCANHADRTASKLLPEASPEPIGTIGSTFQIVRRPPKRHPTGSIL